MAKRGTVTDGPTMLTAKSGSAYGKIEIDGVPMLVFGRTVAALGTIRAGDEVEYSEKLTDKGDATMVTFLKKVGGGAARLTPSSQGDMPTPAAPKETTVTVRPQPRSYGADPEKRLSVIYSYVKDLMVAGLIEKPRVGTPDSVANHLSGYALAIQRRFMVDLGGGEEPKASAPEAADPQ
jgi:hypothetical protein